MNDASDALRREILARTRSLIGERLRPAPFIPGQTPIPYAARVYDHEEVEAGISAMLDFWLTLGPEGAAFERDLAARLGVKRSILVNSGSSANLLAVAALTSHKLGDRRLRPGDEVITAAAGFPTTVAPIVQHRAVPVLIDVDPITANIRLEHLEAAYVPGRTKAVFLAHTLGNPFPAAEVARFCSERGLWLIEDNCDALGSEYDGRWTGSFGDLSTQSFYPPHHMTMGEGGAVGTPGGRLAQVVESFRDWGRDCWCPSGKDDTCRRRFDGQHGELPKGYDHKYVYSHLGYNLKPLDIQAAIGRAQLAKLDGFIAARRANWSRLRTLLADLEGPLGFMLPTNADGWTGEGFRWRSGRPACNPSWFGFMILVRPQCRVDRTTLARGLDRARIGNRMLFGGNLARQPAFTQLREDSGGSAFRVQGDLTGSDLLASQALFVGVYPGLTGEHLEYMASVIRSMVSG